MVDYLLVCQTCEPDKDGYNQCIFTDDLMDKEAMIEFLEKHKGHDVDKGKSLLTGWEWTKVT